MGKYFPDTARHAKAQEFLELKQWMMTVMDYVARFMELARFADDYMAKDMAKVRRFENGLKLSIQGRIVGLLLVRERSRGLLVHEGSRAATIRARERSVLPVRLGKWCTIIANSPNI